MVTSPLPDGWLGLGPVHQIGLVTPDLDAAIERRLQSQPRADWSGWVYGPDFLGWQRIGDVPVGYRMRLAVSGTNPQLELIQPLEGDTSQSRKLAADGESLHHLGILVSDFEYEAARLRALGIEPLESGGGHGLDGDGAFGYFDTRAQLGVLIELIQPPARRPEPQFVHRSTTAGEG